ncbi:MAG TPA: PepSY domain-containing protein [Atopostipes sp.]|nr:PepSY domain-containing protein [Atopostipes sp.]
MTTFIKKFKLGIISLSALTLLAACGDTTEEMPDTETPQETTEDAGEMGNETDDETGTQDTEDETTDEATNDTGTDTGTASAGVLSMDFQVSLDDAVQTFRDTFGTNVNIEQIEFDDDDGQYHYDIQGWDDQNEYEMEVNADTGDIIDQSTEAEDDPEEEALDLENYVTPEEAMNAAVENANTDVVEGWTLDFEDGQAVYEIDLEGAEDVDVDAVSGEVI